MQVQLLSGLHPEEQRRQALDAYARASARALGFELEEIEEWQCCGGVYPLGSDEIATKLASVRALNDGKGEGPGPGHRSVPPVIMCSNGSTTI